MKRIAWVTMVIGVLCAVRLAAQGSEPDVRPLIERINAGGAAEVRPELPALLAKYPNNPAVLYVQGLLATEGAEAVRIFQSIVDNFPASEWADDALYRVYQFYYALGLYRTAELKMNQLRRDYPASRHLAISTSGDLSTLPEDPDENAGPSQAEEQTPVLLPAPAAPDTTARQPVAPPAPPRLDFVLQAGAFTAVANAERQKSHLEELGYSVEIRMKTTNNRSLYTVLVGAYASADDARAAAAALKRAHGIDAIVVGR